MKRTRKGKETKTRYRKPIKVKEKRITVAVRERRPKTIRTDGSPEREKVTAMYGKL